MLNYVEFKIIQVRLRLMMNKMFYLGEFNDDGQDVRVKMMVMMTMVVILKMNNISNELWMFEDISIYVSRFFLVYIVAN